MQVLFPVAESGRNMSIFPLMAGGSVISVDEAGLSGDLLSHNFFPWFNSGTARKEGCEFTNLLPLKSR